jgi:hypothetical protein
MYKITRLSSSAALTIATMLVAAVPAAGQSGDTAKASALKVSVLCVLSATSAYPFPAGNDRCFKEIDGRTAAPSSANACVSRTLSGLRVTFVYSATAKAECNPAIAGKQATQDEYEAGLQALGSQEKAFFLAHIGARE